jgi:hypothetical protein
MPLSRRDDAFTYSRERLGLWPRSELCDLTILDMKSERARSCCISCQKVSFRSSNVFLRFDFASNFIGEIVMIKPMRLVILVISGPLACSRCGKPLVPFAGISWQGGSLNIAGRFAVPNTMIAPS